MQIKLLPALLMSCIVVATPLFVFAADIQKAEPQFAHTAAENEILGLKAAQKNDMTTAQLYFSKAYEIDPSMFTSARFAAVIAAETGDVDAAFAWLERAYQAKMTNVNQIRNSKNFEKLHADPRWAPLVKKFEAAEQAEKEFWNGKQWTGSYKAKLSEDERVAGLSKVWSEIKFNFAFPEKLQSLQWDQLYLQYLPKVRAAKDNVAYYQTLMEMVALLKDGHTNVYPPDEELDMFYAKPKILTELVEGKVILRQVGDAQLQKAGISAGDEVLAVNGLPVRLYMEKNIAPFVSSPTPQDMDVRLYQYGFLIGKAGESLTLTLQKQSGETVTQAVKRAPYKDRLSSGDANYELVMRDDGIAVVTLGSFGNFEVAKAFIDDFSKISSAKALILDVRTNGGGSGNVGFEILRTLANGSFTAARATVRNYRAASRIHNNVNKEYTYPQLTISPNPTLHFNGPVVVLAGGQTFSAAEDFVVAFKNMKRGKVIGGLTAGSTGQPLGFTLPGGGEARVCTKNDSFPDGTAFVGTGIVPDITSFQTLKDLRQKTDTVLERAVAELTAQMK
jgi:C-terminal processing protease CtpA/Prc